MDSVLKTTTFTAEIQNDDKGYYMINPKTGVKFYQEDCKGHHIKFTPDTPSLITKEELAECLQISTRSVDNFVKQGIIPKIKLGASTRFDLDDVINKLKEQKES